MKVERRQWGDVTIMTFVGEFDAFNLSNFSSKIDHIVEGGNVKLVFNLRLMTFINSSALGYLVKTKRKVQELGGDLVLVQPSKFVKKALKVLGLQEYFKVMETEEEGVLCFHRPGEVEGMRLDELEVEPDEKLLGENAIMFRVLDDKGESALGPTPFVGKISSLYRDGLRFRWSVPAVESRSALHAGNFGDYMEPGRTLSLKFRQPFAAKTKYFEAKGSIVKTDKDAREGDNDEATVHVQYTDIAPEDKQMLDTFVDDIEGLRREVRPE